jgi:hypothetical protein
MAKEKIASTKTDIVRDYLKGNPTASAGQIVTDLKAHDISPALAAKVKSRYGKKSKPGRKPQPAAPAAPSTNGATKADQIREVAGAMEKPVRPKDVVATLAAQGVDVSFPHVAKVLASMGMKKRKRRRRKAAGSTAPAAHSTPASLSIDDLVAAKKLVGQVGSIEKVKEALAALARLG